MLFSPCPGLLRKQRLAQKTVSRSVLKAKPRLVHSSLPWKLFTHVKTRGESQDEKECGGCRRFAYVSGRGGEKP